METINSLVFIAILLIVVDAAYSLRCYNCNSTNPDRSCFDPIDKNYIPSIFCNISDSETCMSFEAFDIDLTKERIIARKYCAQKTSENICGSIREGFLNVGLNVTSCTSCETDNCNAILTNWGKSNRPGQFVFVFGAMVLISRLILSKIK